MPDHNEPIDLQRRRLAHELQEQLGGLFGIQVPDIERAIERLWSDIEGGNYSEAERQQRIPPVIQRVLHGLDIVYDAAYEIHNYESDETQNLDHILELLENYRHRIERLRARSPDGGASGE